jgi:hypothetical protein
MIKQRPIIVLALALPVCLSAASLPALAQTNADEPPIANRPEHFNGAIGSYTKIVTKAEPTTVQAEDPIEFTVRIESAGPVRQAPRRINLRRLPDFARRFVIEDLVEETPAPGLWEFSYRLRPLSSSVKQIPALQFDYYKPGIIPPEKGYRSRYADPIPLSVSPRTEVAPADVKGPGEPAAVPESFYRLVEGADAVLRRDEPPSLPQLWPVAMVISAVPALCAGWYVLWRYRYPDAGRLARRRQSRAARRALQSIKAMTPEVRAHAAESIVADYLRERWNLTSAEPTPVEVAAALVRQGCDDMLARRAAAFFKDCDRARFAPELAAEFQQIVKAALELVQSLEEQACSAHSS